MSKNTLIILFILPALNACIEPFTPEINEYQNMLVINGKITNQEGYQYVEVSHASSFNNPVRFQESGCDVKVYDDKGNIFQYNESSPGYYRCLIDTEYLSENTRYKLVVVTKDNVTYESGFDQMLPCADIDTVYYEVSEIPADNYLLSPYPGIQFYVDTKEAEGGVSNYRWELEETYEYHSRYNEGDWYDGEIHFTYPDDYADSLVVCWRGGKLKGIYTMSTRNYATNKITRGLLNFVDNQTDRLSVKYSLLVKQFSLSDSAYDYWSNMKQLTQETGGLYETQPIRLTGNIRNRDNPDETVLGYFWASSFKQKRVFYKRNFEFSIVEPPCELFNFTPSELEEYLKAFDESEYPIYLINLTETMDGPWDTADQRCFNCRLRNGTTTKPEFWE